MMLTLEKSTRAFIGIVYGALHTLPVLPVHAG